MATTTETQLEENLGADHPKLQAFQKAVEAALRKRLQEADEEFEFLMKENADKKESRSEHTTQLHETQRQSLSFEEFLAFLIYSRIFLKGVP